MRNVYMRKGVLDETLKFPKDALYSYADGHVYIVDRSSGKLVRFHEQDQVIVTLLPLAGKEDEQEACIDSVGLLKDARSIQAIDDSGGILFIATEKDLFTFTCINEELSYVMTVEQGIINFSANPRTHSTMILLTGEGTMVVMSIPDGNVLSEVQLNLSNLDEPSTILWRRDSEFFCVNYSTANGRKLDVFDANGTYFSTNDPEVCIDSYLVCWQPSGGLIAVIEKDRSNGINIAFLELNGLIRSKIQPSTLSSLSSSDITFMGWSSYSDLLMVKQLNEACIWQIDNGQWTLSKVVDFKKPQQMTSTFSTWSDVNPYSVILIHDEALYSASFRLDYTLKSQANRPPVQVKVHKDFLLLETENAPISEDSAKVDIGFNILETLPHPEKEIIVCLTTEQIFCLISKDEKGKFVCENKFRIYINEDSEFGGRNLFKRSCCVCSFVSLTPTVYFFIDYESKRKCYLVHFKIMGEWDDTVEVKVIRKVFETEELLLSADHSSNSVFVKDGTGQVFQAKLSEDEKEITVTPFCTMPPQCSRISIMQCSIIENTRMFFGFDEQFRRLYVRLISVCNDFHTVWPDWILIPYLDCTSFIIFEGFVLASCEKGFLQIFSENCLLDMISKCCNIKQSLCKDSEPRYKRKFDKNALLVACFYNSQNEPCLLSQIVPRGDTETIHPKPLLISSIEKKLNQKKIPYNQIMETFRRHKLNYSLLVKKINALKDNSDNHIFQTFSENMLKDVQNFHSVVLFINDLSVDEHIEAICILKDLLYQTISRLDGSVQDVNIENAYLVACAKLGEFEEALMSSLILGQKDSDRISVKKRIALLGNYCTDPYSLIDCALGMYDMSLASLLADCLGKDPKEYLPMLTSVKKMEGEKRIFFIDNKLKRFDKACFSLIRDVDVSNEAILSYLEKNRLFTAVITYLEGQTKEALRRSSEDIVYILQETKKLYACNMKLHGRYREAAILFESVGSHKEAMDAMLKCGHWKLALELSEKHDGEAEKKELIDRLLSELEQEKKFSDAAELSEYMNLDSKCTVSYLAKAKMWIRAKAFLVNREDEELKALTVSLLKNDALEKIKEIEDLHQDIESKMARLQLIRKNREEKGQKLFGEPEFNEFSDTESLSSVSSGTSSAKSGVSGYSEKSARISKNTRKLKKKLYSMKEGSKFEHFGITVHLWNCINKIMELKTGCSYTVESLYYFGMKTIAADLISKFDKLLVLTDGVVLQIWSKDVSNGVIPDEIIGSKECEAKVYCSSDVLVLFLDPKFRVAPIGWNILWSKLCLHESSNKALVSNARNLTAIEHS